MPSDFLLSAIQATHDAIAHEPNPADKQTLSVCLQNMLKIQAAHHQPQAGGQAGGPPQGMGSPPAGPQTPGDPRMAMMAALTGR
jgi:hypothetical protein